jgi:hypothetical protein
MPTRKSAAAPRSIILKVRESSSGQKAKDQYRRFSNEIASNICGGYYLLKISHFGVLCPCAQSL